VDEAGDALAGEAGGDPLEGEAGGSASAGGQRDGRRGMLAGVLGEEGYIVVEDLIAFLFSFRVFFANLHNKSGISVQVWPVDQLFFL
jgi:hypothetical protein